MKKILSFLLIGVMFGAYGISEASMKEIKRNEKEVKMSSLENCEFTELYNTDLGNTTIYVNVNIEETTPVEELREFNEVVLNAMNIQEIEDEYSQITFVSIVNEKRTLLMRYKIENKEFVPDIKLNSNIYKEV